MTTVALTSHFDGEKVQFDELCRLDPNARLMVVPRLFETLFKPGHASDENHASERNVARFSALTPNPMVAGLA
jgi:hypothetical protein